MQPRGIQPTTTTAERAAAPLRRGGLPSADGALSPLNPETLVEAQRRSGLSDAELARIFHVRAACLDSWRRHGVPRADAHRLSLLTELIDALQSCGTTRLTATLRRPLPQPGEPTLVDLLSRRDSRAITSYLRALDPGLSLTGHVLGS